MVNLSQKALREGEPAQRSDVYAKRGLVALTIDALPPPGADDWMHWHQMSDTLDHIDPQALAGAHAFTWQILQEIDQRACVACHLPN